jgi:murein DD-endopeptidase MepM/ murein hydrolase activator NlpD
MHTGVDIDAETGTPVGAAAPGRVVLAETYFGYGETVIVNHGGSMKTLYGHLSEIKVKAGDRLAAGDVVGLAGCTGDCTGDHLHFEVRIKDRPVDPSPFLPARFPPASRVALDPGYAPLAASH